MDEFQERCITQFEEHMNLAQNSDKDKDREFHLEYARMMQAAFKDMTNFKEKEKPLKLILNLNHNRKLYKIPEDYHTLLKINDIKFISVAIDDKRFTIKINDKYYYSYDNPEIFNTELNEILYHYNLYLLKKEFN